MARATCILECEHEILWGDDSLLGAAADLPWVGRTVYCPDCEQDMAVVECEPDQLDYKTVLLSDCEPHQTSYPGGMAYAAGDRAAIFFDTRTGTWGWCLHGVGDTGLAYESEDETGWASPEEAEEVARQYYKDNQEEYVNI